VGCGDEGEQGLLGLDQRKYHSCSATWSFVGASINKELYPVSPTSVGVGAFLNRGADEEQRHNEDKEISAEKCNPLDQRRETKALLLSQPLVGLARRRIHPHLVIAATKPTADETDYYNGVERSNQEPAAVRSIFNYCLWYSLPRPNLHNVAKPRYSHDCMVCFLSRFSWYRVRIGGNFAVKQRCIYKVCDENRLVGRHRVSWCSLPTQDASHTYDKKAAGSCAKCVSASPWKLVPICNDSTGSLWEMVRNNHAIYVAL